MYTYMPFTYMLEEKLTAYCALSVLGAGINTTKDTIISRGTCLISKLSQERISRTQKCSVYTHFSLISLTCHVTFSAFIL